MSELSENDIVTRINMTLETLLKDMTFCQHDSEYRMVVDDETPSTIDQLNKWFDILSHSNNEYYLYGSNPYPLTEHLYKMYYQNTTYYAFKNVQIISEQHYTQYCKKNNLDPDGFIYKNEEKQSHKQSLKLNNVVNQLIHKNGYRLPHTIYFLAKNGNGKSVDFHLNKFKFLDVLKMAKALK